MKVIERIITICGETQFAGIPCALIRFAGCSLRCSWCDTPAAFSGGIDYSVDELETWVQRANLSFVLLTGGEPLLQKEAPCLAAKLACSHRVLVETSGAYDIQALGVPILRSMDIKCPGSGEVDKNLWDNLNHLRDGDALKMVLVDRKDYDFAKDVLSYPLHKGVDVLLSPAAPHLSPQQLAQWILNDKLKQVRLNLQIHNYIWSNREGLTQEDEPSYSEP